MSCLSIILAGHMKKCLRFTIFNGMLSDSDRMPFKMGVAIYKIRLENFKDYGLVAMPLITIISITFKVFQFWEPTICIH